MTKHDWQNIPEGVHVHPMSDKRPNGRCRAYWRAYATCPGSRVGYDWASERFEQYVAESKEKDLVEGMMSCCCSDPFPQGKPIRERTRR